MLNPSKVVPLTPFGTFMGATPVLPSMYWDVYSAEQRWKAIAKLLKKLCDYVEYMGDEVNVDRDTINQLLEDFDKFKESGFFDYYAAQIEQWIRDNFTDVMRKILNQGIFFGLTADGYFCANVANQLTFVLDTIVDYSNENYGRLTITY
jgi:hypothetical protein